MFDYGLWYIRPDDEELYNHLLKEDFPYIWENNPSNIQKGIWDEETLLKEEDIYKERVFLNLKD